MSLEETRASSPPQAVLTSGGLDSAILLAYQAREYPRSDVYPIYIRSDLAWEAVELEHLHQYLRRVRPLYANIAELIVLHQPAADLYGQHWSTTGLGVPDDISPDEAVYLPGRNVLLSAKALLWCHLHDVESLALGVLASNPFPDASPEFFAMFARAVGKGVANERLRLVTPFAGMNKTQVMRLVPSPLLEWSFSCIRPADGRHCGRCSKCAERKKGFGDVGLRDPTPYAPCQELPCTASPANEACTGFAHTRKQTTAIAFDDLFDNRRLSRVLGRRCAEASEPPRGTRHCSSLPARCRQRGRSRLMNAVRAAISEVVKPRSGISASGPRVADGSARRFFR
jgi:7-cyano-7-deazaguanine synthase